jgi:hypothetical protein
MTRHIIAVCGAMALAGLTASAQTPQRPASQSAMTGDTITATGCLKVWDEAVGMARSDLASPQAVTPGARQYVLANVQGAGDGTTFVLETQSSSGNLRGLVNHTVEVTGHMRGAADHAKAQDAAGRDIDALATLSVSSVKSVASSCR